MEQDKLPLKQRLKNLLCFTYLSSLLCWALNSYVELLHYLQEGSLFARRIDGHPYTNDFVLFYNGALLAAESCKGKPFNIYDPQIQNAGVVALTAPVIPELNYYLQYPPHFFTLVRPLAGMGITNAWYLWCVFALVLILLVLNQLSKELSESKFVRAFLFVAVFASFPAWNSFQLGQTSLYQFPALAIFWLLLRSKKYFLAGILSAILLVKLQYIPIIITAGLIIGRGKYLAGIALSGCLLAIATVLTVGWSNIINYPQALLYGETSKEVSGVAPFQMQNLRGELFLLQGGETHIAHIAVLCFFATAVVLLASMWFFVYPRLVNKISRPGAAFEICASITVLLMLIASPHTHAQEYLSATIPCVFLYRAFNLSQANKLNMRIVRVAIISFPVFTWISFIFGFLFKMILVQPLFFWAILILSITVTELKRLSKSENVAAL